MSTLDDAIREHLDLKRKHGAREAELREIEDEAFGAGDQPDPFVGGEIYTEVGSAEVDAGNEEPTRLVEAEAARPTEPALEPEDVGSAGPDLFDTTEPPPEAEAVRSTEPPSEAEVLPSAEPPPEPEDLRPTEPEPETSDQPVDLEPPSQMPGQAELPGQDEIPGQERLEAEPDAPAPSESLEELIAEEEPFPEDIAAPPPAPAVDAPSPVDAEPGSRPLEPPPDAEARPGPESQVPDPPPPPPGPDLEPPGRARGRVDVPTQEHPPPGDTGDLPSLPGDEPELGRPDTSYEPPPLDLPDEEPVSDEEPLAAEDTSAASDRPQLYDFETDEEAVPPAPAPSVDDDFEALGPAQEEAPYLDEEEPYPEEPASGVESDRERYEEPGTEVRPAIEEEEDEDDLWFEKGPPKDFDFDD